VIIALFGHREVTRLFVSDYGDSGLAFEGFIAEILVGEGASEGEEVQSWAVKESMFFIAKSADSDPKLYYFVPAFISKLPEQLVILRIHG
jgi:hypothetical protein